MGIELRSIVVRKIANQRKINGKAQKMYGLKLAVVLIFFASIISTKAWCPGGSKPSKKPFSIDGCNTCSCKDGKPVCPIRRSCKPLSPGSKKNKVHHELLYGSVQLL